MRGNRIYGILLLTLLCGFSFAQTEIPERNRYITKSIQYGAGYTNILDTYLSPLEYTGTELRILWENTRMTNLWDGNISSQNILQTNLSYTKNNTETSSSFGGLVNWSYGLHYNFQINENFRILAGGMGDLNFGFIYNLRNSNNPANAKAYINLLASGMAIYRFKINRYPVTARYQVNVPFAGIMFSPDYQQSYYEIFTVGNTDNIIKFTSLHNQPSVRQMISFDFPVRSSTIRISYVADIQQSYVNRLKTHTYSHILMIGFVKTLYRVRNNESYPIIY